MANLTLRQIGTGLAISGALAVALLLNRLMVSDKTRVEKVIRSIAEEAGRADVNAIFSHVAADYEDDVQDRAGLQAAAEKAFARYGPLRIAIRQMTVNMSGRLASVEVTISGRAFSRNRKETEGTWVWNIHLRKDPDEVWRVTRATPLKLEGTDEIPDWRALYGAIPPRAAPMSLYDEAEQALKEGRWADAAAKFKEFAEKHPDHPMVAHALYRAAGIYQVNLHDKQSASEVRRWLVWMRIAAIQEKRAASYTSSEDLEKGVAWYRRLLAVHSLMGASNMRLRLQYEVGELLEKLHRTEEAAEAYKAVAALPGDSPNSKMLREQAKKKEDALVATASK